jgi:hypothetical protein
MQVPAYYDASAKHREHKRCLHEDFHRNGRIQDLVSYIYFPKGRGVPSGHAAVEVEGNVFSALCDSVHVIKLSRLIASARKDGLPFLRFPMPVTPEQLQTFREHVQEKTSIICSHAALRSIKHCGGPSVPFLSMFFPSISALFLTKMRYDHPDTIGSIALYHNGNNVDNILKVTPGVVGECVLGVLIVCMIAEYL